MRARPILVLLLLATAPALAHRFHVSIAEAEFSSESGKLEIALSVRAQDMEEAFGLMPDLAGSREESLAAYVAMRWHFTGADGRVRTPEWVGVEPQGKNLWLYFEVAMPGGLEGARIENRMFFELDPRQVNTVNFRQDDWRFSVAYRQGHEATPFSRHTLAD
jgi:hypothetical protein